jgi:hypothetical protein
LAPTIAEEGVPTIPMVAYPELPPPQDETTTPTMPTIGSRPLKPSFMRRIFGRTPSEGNRLRSAGRVEIMC